MKKAEMLNKIRIEEATAWRDLAQYLYFNKPPVSTWAEECSFTANDPLYRERLGRWDGLHQLLCVIDDSNVEPPEELKNLFEEAFELNRQVYARDRLAGYGQ